MYEIKEKDNVESMIYEIRGVQVMLSSDVAKLYQVDTKVLNQTIKRNVNRFPSEFCFQLTEEEFSNLRSQIVTSNLNNYGGIRYCPYVLTEQGIMMLSGLLKSDIAVKVNIEIIKAFVNMRKYISNDLILVNHENRLLKLEESFNQFKEKKETIIYENTIYDSYSLLLDIFNKSKEEIIIVDNYANKELFDILRNIDRKITIISSNLDKTLIDKYTKQYNNIRFINYNLFHDRYIVIDNKEVYVSGMSLKDIGKKYSYIYKMNEEYFIKELIDKLKEVL